MELTVNQALRQGVAAHKEGKLQDAERLYRAILRAQPNHPDANHNLGVLAVAVGKPLEAIPLFKLALDANSQIEQFWLSYIDVLMRLENFDEAKRVLVDSEKSGVSSDKLDALHQRLKGIVPNYTNETAKGQALSEKRKRLVKKKKSSKTKAQTASSSPAPSQDQINHLLGHYQAGRLKEAEALAASLTQQFPKHPFGWKVLAAVFKQTGRLTESLAPMQKAAELSPKDVDAHYNLGNTLRELRKLDESEASYRQAIALKPDYAEVHYNLGITLKELGRLDEAEASYKQAIASKPDLAAAHSNLGNTLKELGRLDEAEASHRRAIALRPNLAEAHHNLGITLKEVGKIDEAEASYRQAISLKSDYAEAHYKLGMLLKKQHRYHEAISHFDLANNLKAIPQSLECLYIAKDYELLHERLRVFAKSEGVNIGVAAVSAFVSHQLKTQDPYQFCKTPLDYISVSNVREFEHDADGLINKILTEADAYQLRWESRTTKFGFQGPGDIFVNPSNAVSTLERIIGKALTRYYDNHKGASERFITDWPTSYRLLGWFNRLLKNGYQISHNHPTGWLSGVIYLKTTPPLNNNAGAIEFSLHGHELPVIEENIPQQTHNPEEGDIVLFPSSLFHKTIPFTTDTERCVIAFDMQPVVPLNGMPR